MGYWSLSQNAASLLPSSAKDRAGPLDGLRVLSLAWIVWGHSLIFLYQWSPIPFTEADFRPFGFRVLYNGIYAVDMLFVISGYLIMATTRRELDAAKGVRAAAAVVASFFARRLLRILPAYVAALVLWSTIAHLSQTEFGAGQVALCAAVGWRNLAMVNNFWPFWMQCMGWSWSIALEFQFYVVSPAIVWTAARFPRLAVPVLALLTAASIAAYMGMTYHAFVHLEDGCAIFKDTVYQRLYARRFAFTLGMWAAVLVERDVVAKAQRATLGWHAVGKRFLAGAVLVGIAATTEAGVIEGDTGFGPVSPAQVAQLVLWRPLFAAAMAYVVYDLLSPRCPGDRYQSAVRSLLSLGPIYTVAQLSYGLYLFHLMFVYTLYVVILPAVGVDTFAAWMPPAFAVITAAAAAVPAVVVYLLLEKPMINASNAYFKRGPPKPAKRSE